MNGQNAPTPVRSCVPADTSQRLAPSARQDFLWKTLAYLSEYARFADTKAAFAGTLAGALIGCLYEGGFFKALVQTSILMWTLPMWMTSLAAIALFGSVVSAGFVVYPRLGRTKCKGLIFWDGIAAYGSVDGYKEALRNQTDESLTEEIQQQVFDVAKYVIVPKYQSVSWCLWTLLAGALFAITALTLPR